MDLILHIVGYAFLLSALGVVFYIFVKLLTTALDVLRKNDD